MGLFDIVKSFTPASLPMRSEPMKAPVSLGAVIETHVSRSAGPPARGDQEPQHGGGFVISTPRVEWAEKMLADYAALNTILIDRIGAAVTPFDPYLLLTYVDNSGYLSGGNNWKLSATTGQGYDADPELLAHLEMANERDTFQDVLDQWAEDVCTFGNAYIETVRTATTANFYNMAALRTRVKPNRNTDYLSFVHYEYGLGLLVYRLFDEFVPGQMSGVRQFRLTSRRGHRYYGDPEYISAKRPLTLNYDILSLAEKFFENSFMGDIAITFKGADYTEEDIQRFRSYLTQTAKGLDNAHKIAVFQVGPNEDVKIDKLNLDIKDASFQGLRSDNKEEIVIANRVPPALLGIAAPGKLASTNEIREALRAFKVGFANARQQKYEKWWQHMFRDAGLPKWNTFKLRAIDSESEDSDIPNLAQAVTAGIMTADEARAQLDSEKSAKIHKEKRAIKRVNENELIQGLLDLRDELLKQDGRIPNDEGTTNG